MAAPNRTKNEPQATSRRVVVMYVLLNLASTLGVGALLLSLGARSVVAAAFAGLMFDPLWRSRLGMDVSPMIVARSIGMGIGGVIAAFAFG